MYNSLLLTALLLKYLGKQLNVVLPMAYRKLYREIGPIFVGARTIGCSIQSFFFFRSVTEYPEFLTGIFGRMENALVVFGPWIE